MVRVEDLDQSVPAATGKRGPVVVEGHLVDLALVVLDDLLQRGAEDLVGGVFLYYLFFLLDFAAH